MVRDYQFEPTQSVLVLYLGEWRMGEVVDRWEMGPAVDNFYRVRIPLMDHDGRPCLVDAAERNLKAYVAPAPLYELPPGPTPEHYGQW